MTRKQSVASGQRTKQCSTKIKKLQQKKKKIKCLKITYLSKREDIKI